MTEATQRGKQRSNYTQRSGVQTTAMLPRTGCVEHCDAASKIKLWRCVQSVCQKMAQWGCGWGTHATAGCRYRRGTASAVGPTNLDMMPLSKTLTPRLLYPRHRTSMMILWSACSTRSRAAHIRQWRLKCGQDSPERIGSRLLHPLIVVTLLALDFNLFSPPPSFFFS